MFMQNWRKTDSNNISNYIERVSSSLNRLNQEVIESVIEAINHAANENKNVWIIGNGGSAATASHFATDLIKRKNLNNMRIKAISLSDNSAILTAISNDSSFEEVFVTQLKVLASKDDLLIALSASGNSINLLRAVEYANSAGLKTLCFVGFDGGKLYSLCQLSLHFYTDIGDYGVAEDAQSVICHFISSTFN